MEKLFSERECSERFRFRKLITTYFDPCRPHQSDLAGMNAEDLFLMYKLAYETEDTVLTVPIINNLLLQGGYIAAEQEGTQTLYAKVDMQKFYSAKPTLQNLIAHHLTGTKEITARQVLLGIKEVVYKNHQYDTQYSANVYMDLFLKYWVFKYGDDYVGYMTEPKYRSTLTEIYNYYRFIAASCNWPIVTQRQFGAYMKDAGVHIHTVSVHGKSGYKTYKCFYIPQSSEDIQLSLAMGMAVIYNGTTHWTKEGLLENMTEDVKRALAKRQAERMHQYEGTKKSRGETQESASGEKSAGRDSGLSNVRRKSEIHATPESEGAHRVYTSQKTIREEKKTPVMGRTEVTQITQNQIAQESIKESERTSDVKNGHNESSAPQPATRESHVSKVGDTALKRELAGVKSFGGGNPVDEFYSSESGRDDEASIGEIADAMRIPYSLVGSADFTQDVFEDWLRKMSIDVPDIMEYYKVVMKILEG